MFSATSISFRKLETRDFKLSTALLRLVAQPWHYTDSERGVERAIFASISLDLLPLNPLKHTEVSG